MEFPSQPDNPPAPRAESQSNRFAFLDWTRGLAAIIMLQGHVFHSFSRNDLRQQDTFILSQFIGGLPPAIFLFLTGVTLAFLMESRERQGLPAWDRVTASLRRAGYLFVLAILFRIQLWLFAFPQSDWSNLFRVDILNCMGFGIAVMSVMAVFTTIERVRLCAILGLAIAAAAPLVSLLDTNSLHPFVRAYFVPSLESFSFFPWAAFLAFGLSAGSVLRLASKQMQQVMQWASWFGIVLIISAQYFSNLPYTIYPKSDFWLNSPGLVLIKLGVILVLSSFAYLWTTHMVTGWSWVRQLGTTSLLIYWTHTELVYGRWLGAWKDSLTTMQTVAMAAVVIALMLGLSTLRSRWKQVREFLFGTRPDAPLPETE
ncbi:MAG: DUF1624 domain-containing protein [Bryobacterales bacterium]|nr:DUF1624 domain-containing protein [Bryobacterales bacterium]